jgi:hypothetical protein
MATRSTAKRFRVGRISIYEHHGSWWLYHRHNGQPARRLVGTSRALAECEAFLFHHENVLRSSLGTISRYRAATGYFEKFLDDRRLTVRQFIDEFLSDIRQRRGLIHTRRNRRATSARSACAVRLAKAAAH